MKPPKGRESTIDFLQSQSKTSVNVSSINSENMPNNSQSGRLVRSIYDIPSNCIV